MSDQGEKTCPLCAEEMDLTDQHLKPCKCGYEICVWCWHHIMDMAEKNDSDGRCPACRAPYNKEKIVGTASNCERLVAEMNTEKKLKSNKGKGKTSEGRKHLTNVRVIQRNLVYLVGLPLNLADEELLQRKEYFGLYGKVLKVSISRTTTGAIQQFPHNTCSVYITYSKEEEAICCIQSVHEFILEGRQLRACFGTTKYCHAWIRNMPCINPDCLYLHEFGSEEDRFTKDEIVSAFSRNKVQQVMSLTNNTQRRSGNALPPPPDEHVNNGSASPENPISKNATINTPCGVKISPPNSSCGRSIALPAGASWGPRASNNQPPTSGNSLTSNGIHKQKVDSSKSPVSFSAAVASSNHIISPHNDGQKKLCEEDNNNLTRNETKPGIEMEHTVADSQTHASDSQVSPGHTKSKNSKSDFSSASRNNYKYSHVPSDDHKCDFVKQITDIQPDISSTCLARNPGPVNGVAGGKEAANPLPGEVPVTSEDEGSTAQNKATSVIEAALYEDKKVMVSSDDPEVTCNGICLTEQRNGLSNGQKQSQIVDKMVHPISQLSDTPVLFSGYGENELRVASSTKTIEDPYLSSSDDITLNMRRFGSKGNAFDVGENTIISDILSLDIDSLDDSLSSQNFAKLLGETDQKQGSRKLSTPLKSQSRFSFAREDESVDPTCFASPVNYIDRHSPSSHSFVNDQSEVMNFKLDKFSSRNGFSQINGEEHDRYNSNGCRFVSDNLAVSRTQISAPPGFSTPKRAPPPGFTSYEKMEQPAANILYGNYTMDASFLPSHQYQILQAGDVEFIDPAILAVGKGRVPDGFNGVGLDMGSRFSSRFDTYENNNNARPQLLMQRSHHNSLQNQGYSIGDRFSSLNDSFRIPSRVVEQSISPNNMSQYSGVGGRHWRDIQNGNNNAGGLLRAERLGFNKLHTGYGDSALLRMPSQADVYNRTFGF